MVYVVDLKCVVEADSVEGALLELEMVEELLCDLDCLVGYSIECNKIENYK